MFASPQSASERLMFESRPDAGCIGEVGPEHRAVLVVFGGLVNKSGPPLAQPRFEFFNVVSDLPVGKIFIRDLDQVFYQRGVRGLGASITDVKRRLGELLPQGRRTVFVGGSAGGYAAMLFGGLLGVDEVLAFGPQTFVSRRLRLFYRDDRWPEEIRETFASPNCDRRYLDLKPFLRRALARRTTRIRIYYGSKNELDMIHATRLRRIPGLTIHPRPTESHGVQRRMREDQTLRPVLCEALGCAVEGAGSDRS